MSDNLTFNQFQQELIKRGIDKGNAYMLTLLYERMIENAKQLDMCANLIFEITHSLEHFVTLNEQMRMKMLALQRERRPDGIDVRSVANEPE